MQLNLKTNATVSLNAGGHAAEGRGKVEERGRRGDVMELGHPVRDLKSPSGELHRGLLSWAAICH